MAETVYTKSELIAVLKDFGREFRIPTIYLFGSYARGEATPESDVDIVIDSRNIHGLLEFERARQYLSDRLGKPVDMISLRGHRRREGLSVSESLYVFLSKGQGEN